MRNDLNIGTLTGGRHVYLKSGGNNTRMFIDGDTGNIGINTSRPEGKLHINGDLRMSLGEGFRLHEDNDFFGRNNDAIIFEIQDTNGTSGLADGGNAGFVYSCLLYTSPSPRDQRGSRMPSSA